MPEREQQDVDLRAWLELRSEFPITRERAYLFAGGLAPLSLAGRAAINAYAALWADDPIAAYRTDPMEQADLLRSSIAALIGAQADCVAILDSTSRGNNLAVQMVPAPPGSNVVVDMTTYPTALYPWLMRDRVEVRHLPSAGGVPDVGQLERFVDKRTVAVSVSHVCRLTGFRHSLPQLAAVAHGVGAALLVDAAQSVGVVPVDVVSEGVDFLSFGAMKWLLGVPGIAFFYVRPEREAAPPHVGASARVREGTLEFPPGAVRHELSSLSWGGLRACREGLRLLMGVPQGSVEARVLELSGLVVEGLRERRVRVRTPREPRLRAGVVAFEHPAPGRLAAAARERGVDVWGWEREGVVRVDPHVYNDEDDIERFFAAYDSC